MKKYKISDIIAPCIVCFKKHNGKGRPITYRTICVTHIDTLCKKTCITYDSYDGPCFTVLEDNEFEIVGVITRETMIKAQELDKVLEKLLNKAFDYGVQATLDNLLLMGYNTKDMLRKQDYRLQRNIDKDKERLLSDLKRCNKNGN